MRSNKDEGKAAVPPVIEAAVPPVNKSRRWSTTLRNLAVLLVVLVVGIGIGNGQLRFEKSKGYGTTQNSQLPKTLNYSSVNDVYDAIKANYNGTLTADQLTDGLKHGLAEATNDPYTEYFTKAEAQSFKDQLDNSFSGIGAELGQDDDKNLIVIAPISGFPADKAGLKAQDIITTINGESTTGMSVDSAVTKIRGKSGTVVKLGIVRDKSQTLTLSITRDTIKLPSVNTKTLDGNIGYIQIISFADDTPKLASDAAAKFKQAGVKGIVLDLRNDPGGLLDSAVDVSSLWLPQGKSIVEEKGTVGDVKHVSNGEATLSGIPTVVLVNSGSASASEITAGALKDNNAAYVIGEKSYGKGVVQQLINFPDGSEIKVTVASWYRPNGQNINKKGITPDKTVTISDDDAKAGTDTQLNAATDYLKTQ